MEHKKLKLANTLLTSDYTLLKTKHAAPSGAEEYTQCQKNLGDAQIGAT